MKKKLAELKNLNSHYIESTLKHKKYRTEVLIEYLKDKRTVKYFSELPKVTTYVCSSSKYIFINI